MFRREVRLAQQQRLHGSVHQTLPFSWNLFAYFFFALSASIVLFVCTATYTYVSTATGQLVASRGNPQIIASRSGILVHVYVHDGQYVVRNQLLAEVESDNADSLTDSSSSELISAIKAQDLSLKKQEQALALQAHAEASRMLLERKSLSSELESLQGQVANQKALVSAAEREFNAEVALSQHGYASRRDLDQRYSELTLRRQQLATLADSEVDHETRIKTSPDSVDEAALAAASNIAAIEGQRAVIGQRLAEVKKENSYAIHSPISGLVSSGLLIEGNSVSAGSVLLTVVPEDAPLTARLLVASKAIGFVKPGQIANIEVDAFPAANFGTLKAVISSISPAAMAPQGGSPEAERFYEAVATVRRTSYMSWGPHARLKPDMDIRVRIPTDTRYLWQWMLAPLYTFMRR